MSQLQIILTVVPKKRQSVSLTMPLKLLKPEKRKLF